MTTDREWSLRAVAFVGAALVAWSVVGRHRAMKFRNTKRVDPALSVNIAGDGSALVVFGTANLPDGSKLGIQAWSGSAEGPFGDARTLDVTVELGRYEARFDPAPWSSGRVSASVELRANATQPISTQEIIGATGERLLYTDVDGLGFRQVFAVVTGDIDLASDQPRGQT